MVLDQSDLPAGGVSNHIYREDLIQRSIEPHGNRSAHSRPRFNADFPPKSTPLPKSLLGVCSIIRRSTRC